MSYVTKWQVEFVSLKEKTVYDVNIMVEGYDGDIIPLRGAASPFETSEDNTEDYFAPIRTQTGYLRIVDNGTDLNGDAFDWTDLIPATNTSHQVQLVSEGTVLWVGYMRAALFTTRAYECVTEYEFPLICPLALLGTIPMQFTSENVMPTFGQLLYEALSAAGVSWTYLRISDNVPSDADLNARVALIHYLNSDPEVSDDIATWTEEQTYQSLLESICSFWGWTIYSRGTDVYVIAANETTWYRRIPFEDLASVVETSHTYSRSSMALSDLEFRSTDHYEDYILGKRKITIEASSGKWDNIVSPPLGELTYNWYGGTGYVVTYGDYSSIQFFLADTTQHTTQLHNYELYFNPILLGNRANIILSKDDSWKTSEEKTSFSLRNNIQCLTGGTEPSSLLNQRILDISTYYAVAAPKGSMISISANVRGSLNPTASTSFDPETTYVRMLLRIGDKYWDPTISAWSETPEEIRVYVNANGRFVTTKNLFESHYGAEGYCVKMTESLYGKIGVSILMSPSQDLLLDALTVKVVPEDDMVFPTAEETNVYEDTASNTFAEDMEVSLDLASGDNNTYGKGQVYNEDGSFLTTIAFRAGTVSPENRLLSRMVSAYSKIRRRLQITVAENSVAALPTTVFDDSYLVQNVNHRWRDDEMVLTIIDYS